MKSPALLSHQPTRPDRGWLVMPFGKNPWWVYVASFVPALLVTILIFMDQQISAVIVNRKENKLKVGVTTLLTAAELQRYCACIKSYPDFKTMFRFSVMTLKDNKYLPKQHILNCQFSYATAQHHSHRHNGKIKAIQIKASNPCSCV